MVSAWATRCADARFSECEMAIGPGSSGLGRPASQEEGPKDRDGSLDRRVFVSDGA